MKIRVQGNNDLPVGVVESGGNGSSLPKVADKLQDPHPRIQPSQALELLGAPIGASIIDEEDFAAGFPGVKACLELIVKGLKSLDFIENRNDD